MPGPSELRDASSLAELLRQEMAERGFTLSQLVSRSDVPRTTMYRWLSGESVHPYHRAGLLRVAAGLGLRKVDANRLLRAAGFPSLEELAASGDPDVLALLAYWSSPVRNNLPADLTSFVGRGEEITTVAELVCHKLGSPHERDKIVRYGPANGRSDRNLPCSTCLLCRQR